MTGSYADLLDESSEIERVPKQLRKFLKPTDAVRFEGNWAHSLMDMSKPSKYWLEKSTKDGQVATFWRCRCSIWPGDPLSCISRKQSFSTQSSILALLKLKGTG